VDVSARIRKEQKMDELSSVSNVEGSGGTIVPPELRNNAAATTAGEPGWAPAGDKVADRWRSFSRVLRLPPGGNDPGGWVWRNNLYTVAVRDHGSFVHLTVMNRDNGVGHDWRDFQRLKNELVGVEAEAVELYPAESRLIDSANVYHLWAFRGRLPFGFDEGRLVGNFGLPQRAEAGIG
jgi:hypothetical protein